MSLRWLSCVALSPPKGGSKTQNGRFSSKIALRLKKVCYRVSLCENCQRQSCRAFIGLSIHVKIIGGRCPRLPEILGQLTALERNRRFSIYFRRSASAVTSSEKSSIITNRKSPTRFPRAQDEQCTLFLSPLPPIGGSQKQSVQNVNNKLR